MGTSAVVITRSYCTAFRRWSTSYDCVLTGVLARGDAKMLVMGGQDDTWDHAAGMLIAQEAGLLVTNGAGVPCSSVNMWCAFGWHMSTQVHQAVGALPHHVKLSYKLVVSARVSCRSGDGHQLWHNAEH